MNLWRQTIKRFLTAALPHTRFLVTGAEMAVSSSGNSVRAPRREIALTFDDGPHPQWTPRLLDLLAKRGMRATFFVIGRLALAHPHLVRRIVAEGHALGNHTWTHSNPARTGWKQFHREVRRTRSVLEELTGSEVSLMRPPHGALTPAKLAALWWQKQTISLWNVDTDDCAMESHEVMGDWAAEYQPAHGDIVLLHDDLPYAETVVKSLPDMEWFETTRFVPLTHWLDGTESDERLPQKKAEVAYHAGVAG